MNWQNNQSFQLPAYGQGQLGSGTYASSSSTGQIPSYTSPSAGVDWTAQFLKPTQPMMMDGVAPPAAPGAEGGNFLGGMFDGFLGKSGSPGWGGPLMQGAGALSSALIGLQNYKLSKEALSASKEQFALNYEMNQKMVNSQLEDRQRTRIANNPSQYQSVDEYMKKYAV